MKKTLMVMVLAGGAAFGQQGFDMKSLDRLGVGAKESTNITLEGDTLKLASAMLGQSKDKDSSSVRSLVDGLRGVYVRSFEYEEAGKYKESDLEPLRAWLTTQGWSRIVDVKEKKETTQIWLGTGAKNTSGGLAIISAEEKQLTVVYIAGTLTPDDLAKLSGNFGIPDMTFQNDGKKSKKEE